MVDARVKAYGTAALIFALDWATKRMIEARVSFFDTFKVIPGFFDIVRSENRGVAFGIFNGQGPEWRTTLLVVASLVAVVVISVILWGAKRLDRYSLWGFALILGGAAGNVSDRMLHGRVTDFLLLYAGDYQWPAFNVADSAIVIGSGLLILDMLRNRKQAANVS